MNTENLNKLIDNYIESFDIINNEEHQEYYKWEAVKHFKDNFNIDAPDFATMFKESVKLTYNLINNRIVQPTNGIVKLAERPELTETIRQMFKDLYADDNGDIDLRQDKIDRFVTQCDNLLNAYEKGKWKYAQDIRVAIFYLCLMHPEQNYIFKSTQANKFKNCIEFSDDFGCGENFSLKKYYKLCDELVAAIKTNDKLMNLHKSRLTNNMYAYDDFHILAYDIIYCAIFYDLYYNIPIATPDKAKSNKNGKEELKKQQEERKNAIIKEITQRTLELQTAMQQRSEYDYFSTKGLVICHKKFGEGIVTFHDSHYILVSFNDGERKFAMPQGFTNGFLTTNSEEAVSILIEIAQIDKQIKEYEDAIYILEREMKNLH